ncbi:MAG: hypothetical protein Q9169_000771 [Polycauliona sp. 2 TL-2023]
MFVAPAQPRPPQHVYIPGGMTPILLDTSNTIGHPTGPEYQLAVGEGVYYLRDDLHLATPPPHPSEHTNANPNPLATAPLPPTAGVKISLSCMNARKPPHLYNIASLGSTRSNLATSTIKESEKESRSSHETSSDGLANHLANASAVKTPVFGEDNALLTPAISKDGAKRKKPKTSLVKSNSSFISRVMPHEAMTKRIQEHATDGLFIFANINRAFQWLDLSPSNDSKAQHVIKILFTKAHMLCHDINPFTKGPNHLDIIMGASSADIMWFEAFSQKYARINKNAVINPSAIHQIKWLPGSENLFLAAHMDGTLIVYDKERDDAAFVPEENTPFVSHSTASDEDHRLLVHKSVNSRNQKSNPVASWKISNHRINDFAFSPDVRHLAVVTEDGSLHVIDYLNEQLKDVYHSYYGAFLCVCWSPDGKYILTGGQDDLVSIWSLNERRLVARCSGHHSWVSSVAFDPWRCGDRNYRFGSVGEDRRLLLWDFNAAMLHRPKALSVRQRNSISSHAPMGRNRTESQATTRFRSNSNLTTADSVDGEGMVEHPVESRTRTAELPPVMSKIIDEDPMSWLGFEEGYIITACATGHIRLWNRPREATNTSQVDLHS